MHDATAASKSASPEQAKPTASGQPSASVAGASAKKPAAKPAATGKPKVAAKASPAKPKATKKPAAKPATKPASKLASKPAAKAASKPTATSAEKAAKAKKPKLVRDSFTIPKGEYAVLADLKLRTIKLGKPAKKSELLRAGIKALAALDDAGFKAALIEVPTIKTGRPKLQPG